ncbi:MAG: YhbY family RNA-binding protein [Lachnospiraceae bacterium]|jgi:RNA-binding protein|nr:YhbY family RNA-binding protein [Lachnospiraceae bacterium]
MTTKQRAYLKGLAMKEEAILHIGKSSLSPEFISSVNEALGARELIKVGVLKNNLEKPSELGVTLSERTGSQLVQVIGRKIVLYKEGKDKSKRINLP